MKTDPFHERLLQIVLSLPGAYEDRPWGGVHCKVDEKIFVGWGRVDDGEMEIGIRVSLELQSMLVASDPRFKIAKYVGKYGGVDMRIGPKPNWNEVEQFIVESYRIIAPKRRVKELDALRGAGSAAQASKPAAKPAAKPKTAKPAAKPKTAKPAAKPKTAKPAAKPKTAKPAAKPKTAKPAAKPKTAKPAAKPKTAKPTAKTKTAAK